MEKLEKKGFDRPDETEAPPKARIDKINLGGHLVKRFTLQPGWRWSEHMKPTVQTEWCELTHLMYQVSGILHVVSENGAEIEVRPGEVELLPPEHDAWVVGDEPVVAIDFGPVVEEAKAGAAKAA